MMIKRNRHGHNPWRLLHHAEGSIPCGSLRLYSAKPSGARYPRRAVGGFRQLVRRCAVVPSAGVQTRRTPGLSSQGFLASLRRLLHPEPAAHQRAHPTAGGRPRVPRPLRVRRAAPAPHHLQPLHPAPFSPCRPGGGHVRGPHPPAQGADPRPGQAGRRGRHNR